MKTFASLAPTTDLRGASDFESAQVDSWVSFATTNIELPVDAVRRAAAVSGVDVHQKLIQSIKADVEFALAVINSHVMYATYMVGQAVTVADIALVCALYEAADVKLWDPANTADDIKVGNICRWYNTLLHQDFFQTALARLSSSNATPTTTTSAAVTSANTSTTPKISKPST